ncbi:MAG: hypothetical protein LUE91_00010, partial [Oscillospiraceae bacterium]|nr:hypothetical protein [Oscillospiraceae bacterium]
PAPPGSPSPHLPSLPPLPRPRGPPLLPFRGGLVVFFCLWLLRLAGLLPQQAQDSALAGFFLSFQPL